MKNKKPRLSEDQTGKNEQQEETKTLADREKLIKFTFEVKKADGKCFLDFKSPDMGESKIRETLNQTLQTIRTNEFVNIAWKLAVIVNFK